MAIDRFARGAQEKLIRRKGYETKDGGSGWIFGVLRSSRRRKLKPLSKDDARALCDQAYADWNGKR